MCSEQNIFIMHGLNATLFTQLTIGKCVVLVTYTLREKCPNKEFFPVRIFLIRIEYGDLLRESPYSVRIRKIQTRKNSVFGHFSRSV